MKEYKYTVLLEPAEEGGYIVCVPAMPEICTEGETLEEARAMAEEAIRCIIESRTKLGEPTPLDVQSDQEPIKEQVAVKFAA